MKIVVQNGSPKGDDSVTIHSVKYLQKRYMASMGTVGMSIPKVRVSI